jgi:type IV secretory pathway protease TraF
MISKREIQVISVVWIVILSLYGISRFYQLKWNISTSMPQKLWLTHMNDRNLKIGDYVLFRFHDYRMPNKDDYEVIVKQVGGIAGDKIISRSWNGYEKGVPYPNKTSLIYILPEGSYPTFDSLSGYQFTPLTRTDMVIPKGCLFVHGQHHPSFDSRYKEFGLVCESQIIGKSYPIF